MIRDIRLKLAITTAGYNQANCTCDRRHVSIHGGGSGSFLRFVLIFCCVTVTCGDSKGRMSRGIKDLQTVLNSSPQIGHCDLEIDCDWYWDRDSRNFMKVMASSSVPYSALSKYPTTDADKSTTGTKTWASCTFLKEIGVKLSKDKKKEKM